MKKNDFVPFAAVIDELERLITEEETGTLFVGTNDNKFAQFAVNKGRIVFITFAGQRGMEAIPLLLKQKRGRYSYKEKVLPPTTDPLPPNDQVLNLLRGTVAGSARDNKTDTLEYRRKNETVTAGQRDVLQEELARFVGPVAAVICAEHCASGATMTSAMQALTAEIGSNEDIQAFRLAVRKRLE